MSEIDACLDLNGHLLRLLLAVHDAGSVTRAAEQLGVTQSAVSHGLDRLRAIVGDALFVKSGRGIAATPVAEVLVQRARALLEELQAFGRVAAFAPAQLQACFTIAANDLQRDLLLPALLARLRAQAPGLRLRVIPSDVPQAALLREDACQLIISPRPPEGSDIFQKRLFEDRYRVFYDPAQREAPQHLDAYLDADHATVVYEPRRRLDIDTWLAEQGVKRRIVVSVPGMAGLGAMLRGAPLLATAPALLSHGALRGLASVPAPLPTPAMPMYMIWHRRHQDDPAQRWLREQLLAVVSAVAPDAAAPGWCAAPVVSSASVPAIPGTVWS